MCLFSRCFLCVPIREAALSPGSGTEKAFSSCLLNKYIQYASGYLHMLHMQRTMLFHFNLGGSVENNLLTMTLPLCLQVTRTCSSHHQDPLGIPLSLFSPFLKNLTFTVTVCLENFPFLELCNIPRRQKGLQPTSDNSTVDVGVRKEAS